MTCIASIALSIYCAMVPMKTHAEPDPSRFGYTDVVFTEAPPPVPEILRKRVHRERKVQPVAALAYAMPENPTTAKATGIFARLFGGGATPSIDGIDTNKDGYRAVAVAARNHGLDIKLALRMARQESGGHCNAQSGQGAQGVMQVMPGTARMHGVRGGLKSCQIGADVGVREMKKCLGLTGGNVRQALACYNAGPAWIGTKESKLPRETRNYIRRIAGS